MRNFRIHENVCSVSATAVAAPWVRMMPSSPLRDMHVFLCVDTHLIFNRLPRSSRRIKMRLDSRSHFLSNVFAAARKHQRIFDCNLAPFLGSARLAFSQTTLKRSAFGKRRSAAPWAATPNNSFTAAVCIRLRQWRIKLDSLTTPVTRALPYFVFFATRDLQQTRQPYLNGDVFQVGHTPSPLLSVAQRD